jgi:hypothetical protein
MYIAPWDYTSEYQKRRSVIFRINNGLFLLKYNISVCFQNKKKE